MNWYMIKTTPKNYVYRDASIFLRHSTFLLFLSLLIALTLSVTTVMRQTEPLRQLTKYTDAIQKGNLNEHLSDYLVYTENDEIGSLIRSIQKMIYSINHFVIREYQLELANKSSELKALQAQINPHFLYNCLDTISWLGFSNGNSEITDLAVALGKFLRASIKREDYYTIKQEMEVVDNYLFIQKYRFGDKIEIRHNIPDEVLNFYIPSFIIQPVIENSIVHGLEEQIEKGILWINIQLCDNKYLQFNLTDNGKGMDEEQLKLVIQNYSDKNKKSGIGLSNVYRRLNLLYGEACEFHVTSVAGEGTEVTFRIPVMQVPGNHTQNEI